MILRLSRPALIVGSAVFVSLLLSGSRTAVVGQDAPQGQAVQAVPSGGRPGPSGRPSRPGQPGQPGQPPGQGGDNGKPDNKKPGEASKPGETPEPKVIRRTDIDRNEPDPDELEVTVGDDGKVAFQFRNQPWVELVQWLADISDKPLDWQELPGDRVHMRSPGRYTVEETRDLFNRYLLARGYTLLEVDGGLTVAKTANINPAIVPRVDVSELDFIQPYSFVRTSLDVGWLSADKLTEELKPMISSNGRLTALTTTNRIEAMDAAVNLRQVAQLLMQERSNANLEALAPEMKLRYIPAEEAKQMLEEFLGVQEKPAPALSPQQIQMMRQMQQRNQGSPQPSKPKEEISIVANPRQNSVIVRAPADRTAIAMQFLQRIDVPAQSMLSLADIEGRFQVFRLASLDPDKLIEIVNDMNILEPTTRIRTDKDNKAIIVSGSIADRFVIKSLIERLDGEKRKLEVLPLRRLNANEVAESIAFLMGQEEDDGEDDSRRRSYYYGFYGNQQEEKKEKDRFRVAANARYNQVLLWANDQEMEEVRSLLIKLGELPPPGGSQRTVRMIDASATPETYEYLQRLQQQWKRLSPNPLELPQQDQFKDPNLNPRSEEEDESETTGSGGEAIDIPETERPDDDDVTRTRSPFDQRYQLASASGDATSGEAATGETDTQGAVDSPDLDEASADAAESRAPDAAEVHDDSSVAPPINSAADFDRAFRSRARDAAEMNSGSPASSSPSAGSPSAVRIEIDRNGNLLLRSDDTEALDRLENLMLQIAPPKRPYHVFHIEHASASWMRLNLEDYYEDLQEDDSDDEPFYRYYFGGRDQEDEAPAGLGKGNKLRFIDDLDTNTLVVTGASPEQLATIAELIELWDVPEPINKRKTRYTKLVQIRYGQATKIAETVKEAYRDLLSSNDKAFAGGRGGSANRGGGGNQQVSKSRDGDGSSLEDSESGRNGGGADFSFKGKLSIGIDEVGNTLLVSAEGEPLLELVEDMIRQLDEVAQPRGEVQVLELPGSVSAETLREALAPIGMSVSVTGQAGTAGRANSNQSGNSGEQSGIQRDNGNQQRSSSNPSRPATGRSAAGRFNGRGS